MMAFCKKSVHSFLSLSNPLSTIDTNNYTNSNTNNCNIISHQEKPLPPPGDLGLITSEPQKVPNVLESAKVKKEKDHPPPGKKDPGGRGFIDDIGGGVDGVISCTESLGFESCDERRADDEMELNSGDMEARSMSKAIKWRKVGERREVKKFPPPLSSLSPNGQPCFFLRPVRRDWRLELTEVRIERPEILRASRDGGWLRLHLVGDENEKEEDEEDEEELLLDNTNNYHHNDNVSEEGISLEEENKNMEEEEGEGFDQMKVIEDEKSEEERRVSSATNTVTNNNNGESSLRRCYEGAHHRRSHHHRHGNHRNDHLHMWSQQCVTTCR